MRMRTLWDVVWVAASALRARPLRVVLMAVGPLLGVAVIVGAIGVLQSTEGELRLALRDLGRNLAEVSTQEERLPLEAVERVRSVSSVEGVAGIASVPVAADTFQHPGASSPRVSTLVISTDPEIWGVLELGLDWGRRIGHHDIDHSTKAVVLGAAVADNLALDQGTVGVVYIGEQLFGIVGVLKPTLLAAELNNAVLIPLSTAQDLFTTPPGHSRLYVRIQEDAVAATARILPTVITYGNRAPIGVSIPTDLLEAQAAIDRTLAGSVIGLGLLAMVVGGFGIANVMLISVLERQREIGVRRALGHSKTVIATQFLAEGALVGVLGAIAGSAGGIVFVMVIARNRDWVFFIDPPVIIGAIIAALTVTLVAALYPATRAARLQPLEALRAD